VAERAGVTVRWLGWRRLDDGVLERRFDVDVDGRVVPGLLWTPVDAEGHRPLVLVGHGASRHKRDEAVVALAGLLVRGHGFAVAAVDGPRHGERRADGGLDRIKVFSEFPGEWCRPGSTDEMVADWTGTLDALRRLDEVGDGPVGYWGLSMGTIYGLPFVAAEPRVQVAVLGLMGLVGPTRDRLATDASRLVCPVLFIQQWGDELFGREPVFELFDALGSRDKRLHANPGAHAAVPADEMRYSVEFLARHLAPASP
jgi:dienelactone hydrolase